MTLADALTEPDLRVLRNILREPTHGFTAQMMVEELRRLVTATHAALVERDHEALVCKAGSPPIQPPYAQISRVIDAAVARHESVVSADRAIVLSLPAQPGREAWLVFLRDDAGFTEADRIALVLLRPHVVTALHHISRRSSEDRMLTARQREVLRLVAQGYRNDQIARQLVVSVGTVRKHLDNVYRQLGVSGRAAAVASAYSDYLTP